MLIPYDPGGLIVLTDRYGKRVAVIDPVTRRVVRMAGLGAPGLSVRLAIPTGVVAAAPFGELDLLNRFSGVFPDQGPYTGGTVVTLIGHHFTGATDVRFGLRPAVGFAVLDDATIMAVTPAGNGAVPVTVTTPGGTARIGYFFYIRWPTLRTILPAAGPIGGGNIVELGGANLSTALLVNFGAAAAHPTAVSDQQLIVAAPPAVGPGTVPVWVTTTGGLSNRLLYTYVAVPTVTGVSPATGPIAGGTTVLVTGTALSRVTAVTVGGAPAASFRAFSDTLLVVVTPPGTAGPADLTLTTPGGTVTVPGVFGYQASTGTTVTSAPDPSVVGQPVTFTATVTPVPPGSGTPTGTVTFDFGDGTPAVTARLTGGTATADHAYADPSGTPYTVTATYGGDTLFTASSGTDTQTVRQADTTTTVTASPDPSLAGQPVTVVALVLPVAPGAGAPTGTVTFDFGDGTPPATLPLSGAGATVTHTYPDTGGSPYTITATYSGDTDFTASTGTDNQTVQQAATATAVSLTPNPSVVGQPVAVSATVTAVPPGAGTPTGTVTLDFGDGTPTVTTPLTGGATNTTHTYTDTTGSPYTVTATYNGDTNFTTSAGTGSQVVGPSLTTTTVTSAPDPSAVGEPATFTATVTAVPPGAGTPTGTVTLDFDDGTTPVTVPLTAGVATATHTFTDTVGSPYAVIATYSGDADFTTSSGTDTHTVQAADTTTAVTSAPDPSVVGEPATFTATVTAVPPGAGTPTGTVTLDFGDGTPTVTAHLTGGATNTTHTYTGTTGSPYTVTATYNGDTNFTTSSGTDTHTVQAADTTTAVTSTPDPSRVGQSTTFVAQVIPDAPASGAPTGTVTFAFSDTPTPVTVPVVGGTATVGHTNPEVADSPYTVAATYSGDANFNASVGADTHDVVQGVSTTVVTCTPSPSVTGQTVTFTATVAAVPPASGTPTGTVIFDFGDGTTPVTASLTGGTVDVPHAYAHAALLPYQVTVTYSGDANFLTSVGTDVHSVEPAATTTTVSAAPDPSVTGETVTVTVTPDAPASGIPTGSATFDFGDGSPIVTAQLVAGSATVTHAYASAAGSPYTITAEYSGDSDFDPSEDTIVHTVAPAATTTTVTSTAEPSAVGQTVTLIARVTPVPPGAGNPTGTVTFDFGDGTPTATAPVSGNLAMVTHAYTGTAGSPYTVTAAYSGDPDFAASTGTTAQRVEMSVSATSTTVGSAPDPSVVGEEVTVTATVAAVPPASGTPTGTVTFEFGDGTAPVAATLSGGTATAAHTYTGVAGSPYSITAVYSGDVDFSGSAGLDSQTVTLATSTTTVTTTPDPSMTGEPVTVTATVAPVDAGAGTPTGTVTLDFGDGTAPVVAPLAAGVATAVHAYAHTAGSPYTVTATYNGDASFSGSTDTDSQSVNPADTSTTLFSRPDPSTVGGPVTFIAGVATVSPATGTPLGTVVFDFGDGTPTVTADAVGGLATVTHAYTGTAGSPYTVTAAYSGGPDFTASAGTDPHTVHQAATTTTVTAAPDPSVVGEPVTVTATVAPVPPGAGVPTGTVTVDFGDGTAPTTAPLTGGAVILTHLYATSLGDPFTVTATYSGSADFTASVGTEAQTVVQAATTTTVASAPDPSVTGRPVTFTAAVAPVAPGGGSPTGTVTFDFGDGTTPAAVPVVAGVATVGHTYAGTSGSPYPVTVAYGGDVDFTGSSATTTQTVVQAPTTTAVSSSPDPSVAGQPVTVTATVSAAAPGAGTPTGTVTFGFDDGTAPVTVPLAAGVATATHIWNDTSGSPYAITADYGGDADFTASTGTDTHTVAAAADTTTVVSSPDPSVVGQPVTVTATVLPIAPGSGTPDGTVTFDFGDGTPTVTESLSGGTTTATHTYATATGSPYAITATYNGEADFTASVGTDTHTVGRAATTTTVGGLPEPSVTGRPVTFIAQVVPDAPGDGAPTGTVTYDFGDGSAPVVVSVTDGTATATHAYATAAGSPFTVTSTYSGDGDFIGSVGTDNHTVEPASSTTVVSSSPDPSVAGGPVTVTATVTAAAPGAGTPTGTVVLTFGDGTPPVTAPLVGGGATHTHVWADTSGSPYAITATYSGDAGFTASTGTDTQTVGPAATTTTVVTSPDPSVTGQPVTVTATVSAVAPGAGTPTGTVTFDFGDGTPAVTATVTAGAAAVIHTWASTSGGPYTITAGYHGDPDFTTSTGTGTHTVAPASTRLTLVSSPDPSVDGQSVTFTARVSAAAPGAGAPTGTVTFDFGDGTPTVTAPVSGGVAVITHVYASAAGSPYTATATYSGDADFGTSTATDLHTVSPSATTTSTTVASSPDPSVTGQPVTFTATVAPNPPGPGVPTGTVTFHFGDGTAPLTARLSGGVATATHAYASATGSPYTVTATYSGDANFSSSSGADTHTVGPAQTTTTTVSSPDPSVAGQPVTFTATVAAVAPGAGVPTGTVTFDFGDGTPATSAAVSGGIARITHTYPSAAGPYTVTATYNGDASFGSSSGTDTQTVNKAATTTAVVSSPDPSVVGQPVTLTATVSSVAPGSGTPTGTLTFDFGDGTATVTAPVSNGLATVTHTYTGTAGSPYTITGSYNGGTDYAASSGTDAQTVNRAATTTAVVSSPDPTVVGQSTTITATVASVAPGSGTPAGTVTFTFGDGTSPVTAPLSGGVATVSHAYAATSGTSYPITATYNGNTGYASSSGTDTQTVNKAATTTAVVTSPDPSVAGQPVALTATVSSVAPGSGTPTGTVTFSFGDGTGSASGTLSGGVATVTHVFGGTSGSPLSVTATYNGDSNFTTSSGTDTQTVNKAATSTSVASSPDPSVVGQPVTLTATVSSVAPGSGVPTGTVTFAFGDGTTAATATLSGGIATVTHPYTTRTGSPFAITATYNGDTNFTTSSGTDTQTVNKATTTTAVVSSPDPSSVGQSVTFTATVAPVSPGAGVPTGTVTFAFGDGTTAATATLTGGIATVTHPYTTRTGSPFAITATYNGDTNFTTSSGTDTQTLNKNTTTTTVTSTPDPSVVGQSVTISATVSSGSGTPTGTVTFAFGDGTNSAVATLSGGVAIVTHTYTTTTGSPFTITATYGGDNSYAGSSGTDTQTLSRAATTTAVVSTPNPSTTGDPVTVTATVAPVAPGTGTPTGTVTLAIPGRTPQTVTLVNGTASATFNPLPKGTYTVTANYNGSVNYAPSAGTTTQVVTTPGGTL
ncbi:Ig-like domain repeat protein [Streptomyces sp. NPDC021212]|uniref:Ig-like domain repeat protein n=1 Tax=Streptomyces sp. NPDC021212 TaxID=3365118 RepID=UPI0037B422ED